MRVLHVDADHAFARLLHDRFAGDGIVVSSAGSVAEARSLLAAREYGAVLLELRLPDGDGIELIRALRSARRSVPLLVVSGLGSEETIIGALEAGADDYVLKPASLELLRARFRALVRRGGTRDGEVLHVGALVVDRARREAWVAESPLPLSALEFNLLAHLAARPDRVQSREALLAAVWGERGGGGGASNVVDVTVGRVRRRLGGAADAPSIEAVRGVGYVLRSPARIAAWTVRAGV